MSHNDIVTPVATVDTSQCMITSPWFVQNTEYPPAVATYKPLVNGEEAFAAVYRAIEKAQKSVDIICWGFQPSMYFIRDGQALRIGNCSVCLRKNRFRCVYWGGRRPLIPPGLSARQTFPERGSCIFRIAPGRVRQTNNMLLTAIGLPVIHIVTICWIPATF